jgi:NAD(P)-dependent dehydrogenase (short-subunit alcohol dehydrogenase family)
MPSLVTVRAANAAFRASLNPIAIFVGGTSGIGQGTVESFTEHVRGEAHIIIIGRNHTAAKGIFSTLPKPTSGQYKHEFVQCDVSRMKNINATTADLATRLPKVNYLFMSQGFTSLAGRDETEEGLDKQLACHYYSRWKFIGDLVPLLQRAKDAGEDAKVLSVLAAGRGTEIDLGDLGLKQTYSRRAVRAQAPTYNDLMMLVSYPFQ